MSDPVIDRLVAWARGEERVRALILTILVLPLAVAWGSTGSGRLRPLPVLGLWSLSTLSLAFLLPGPYKLLGVVPPALAFIAALRVWALAPAPARQSQGKVRARAA